MELILYLLYRLLAFIVPLLPRRAMVWLGRRLGALYSLASRQAWAVGMENLQRVFPERADRPEILREAFRLQGVALLDAIWSTSLGVEEAARYVEVAPEVRDELARAIARGKGVVIATAHFGSWEMFNLAAGAMKLGRATFIARPVANARIDAHLKRSRERTGNVLVYRERAMLACTGALRRGEIVCSVIDMAIVPAEGGIFSDFFGTPAMTSAALAALAHRRDARLALAVCRPLEGGFRYRLEAQVVEFNATAPKETEVPRLVRELNRALEVKLLDCPEAWMWNYKRWKFRPGEEPGPYPSYALWIHPHY